jgi:hypothetical protein
VKVLVSYSGDPLRLGQRGMPNAFKLAVRQLIRDCAFSMDPPALESLKRDIKQCGDQAIQALAVDLLSKLPIIQESIKSDIDLRNFESDMTCMLETALLSAEFETSLEYRTKVGSPSETNEQFFSRTLVPYFEKANSISVIDRYALKNLAYGDSGATWFVNRILEDFPMKVTIHAASDALADYQLRRATHNIQTFNMRCGNRLLVKGYDANGTDGFPHDRFIQLRFRNGGEICIGSNKGLEALKPHSDERNFWSETSEYYLQELRKAQRLPVSMQAPV